jgi:hypothetical protein
VARAKESRDVVRSLPSPEAHRLPPNAAIVVPVPTAGLTLYRLLRGANPRPEDFEPTFTRPQAQIRGIPELFRTSVSHWLSPQQAAAWSTQKIYRVARLELRPDPLTRVALTERADGDERIGHVDVWAHRGRCSRPSST